MQNDLLLRMQSWLDAQPPQEGRTFDLMHPEVLISSAFQSLVLQERALRLGIDMREKQTGMYPVLFLRDNMYRVLAQEDDDFSRNIAGDTIENRMELLRCQVFEGSFHCEAKRCGFGCKEGGAGIRHNLLAGFVDKVA